MAINCTSFYSDGVRYPAYDADALVARPAVHRKISVHVNAMFTELVRSRWGEIIVSSI